MDIVPCNDMLCRIAGLHTRAIPSELVLEPQPAFAHFSMHQLKSISLCDSNHRPSKINHDKTIHYHEIELPDKSSPSPSSSSSPYHPQGWLPYTLTVYALVLLALVFGGLIGSLAAVWQTGRRQNGFEIISTNHYLWTYGPTAVLTLLVSVWRQIDYHSKSLVPWMELTKGSVKASRSMLLDYISPFQIVSLWQGTMNGHFVVTTTTLTFILLKLITVASTSLLVPVSTEHSVSGVSILVESAFDSQSVKQHNITSSPFLWNYEQYLTAYGILGKGLQRGANTYDYLAYDNFSILSPLRLSTSYRFNSTAFIPRYDCEELLLDVYLPSPNSTEDDVDEIRVHPPGCNPSQFKNVLGDISLDPKSSLVPSRQLSPFDTTLELSGCSNSDVLLRGSLRKVFSLLDFRYTQVINASHGIDVSTSNWSKRLVGSSSVICTASYRLETVEVIAHSGPDATQNISIKTFDHQPDVKLDNLTTDDLILLHDDLLWEGKNIFGNSETLLLDEDRPNPMFVMMMVAANSSDYDVLMNTTTMARAAERALSEIAIQIADSLLRTNTSYIITGEAYFDSDRLHISSVSAWFMTTGFAITTIATIFMIVLRPKNSMPDNSWKLANLAILTARSPTILNTLPLCRSGSFKTNSEAVAHCYFTIAPVLGVESNNGMTLSASTGHLNPEIPTQSDNIRWWTQFTFRQEVLGFTIFLPAALIVILELLQRLSDHNSGFANIDSSSSLVVNFATRYLPALTMLCTATLYNCLDFNVLLLSPFKELRDSGVLANRLTSSPYLGNVPVHTVWRAIHRRDWLVMVSSLAALAGTFLTVIVSGLFTVINLPVDATVVVSRMDQWNTSWNDAAFTDRGAAAVLSFIESSSLSFPPMTFEEIAIPRVSINISCSSSNTCGTGLVQIEIPGARASLECTLIPTSVISSEAVLSKYYLSLEQQFNYTLPANCPYGGQYGNESHLSFHQTVDMGQGNGTVFFGKIRDIHIGPRTEHATLTDEHNILTQPDNPPGCPSLIIDYGYIRQNDTEDRFYTAMVCHQYIDMVKVNVTLQMSDSTISTSHPPVVDDLSTKRTVVPNSIKGETAFQYRIQPHIQDSLVNMNSPQFAGSRLGLNYLDNFFQNVLYGQHQVPSEYFQDESYQPRMLEAIQHMYRLYMAQAISNNMRAPISNSSAVPSANRCGTACLLAPQLKNISRHSDLYLPPGAPQIPFSDDIPLTFTGKHINATSHGRLVQHKTPKLILQSLLGFMLMCGIIVVSRFSFRELVIGNPCTIWGSLALWQGSKFCSNDRLGPSVPLTYPSSLTPSSTTYSVGSDHLHDSYMPGDIAFWKPEKVTGGGGLWRNLRFKLGWWLDTRTGNVRYGIDVITVDDDDDEK